MATSEIYFIYIIYLYCICTCIVQCIFDLSDPFNAALPIAYLYQCVAYINVLSQAKYGMRMFDMAL